MVIKPTSKADSKPIHRGKILCRSKGENALKAQRLMPCLAKLGAIHCKIRSAEAGGAAILKVKGLLALT